MKKNYILSLVLTVSLINLNAQSPNLYGLTTFGGNAEAGAIFKTDITGQNYSLIDTFDVQQDGTRPSNQELLEVGGKFYGVTEQGGNYDRGVLFEFDPVTNSYLTKHHFNATTGEYPRCFLLLGSNGKIYGTTSQGGTSSRGTLFEYTITSGILVTKYSFITSDGYRPSGQMVEASTGLIYGVCQYGGSNSHGTIFEYSITNDTMIKKGDFSGTITGRNATAGLMKANNGKLYGTCYSGGANDYGTLFEFNLVTSSITNKFDFDAVNGRYPRANLIQAANGKLYGTTYQGGFSTYGNGTIFEFNITTDSLKKLHVFFGSNSSKGYYPQGSLLETTPGKFLLSLSYGGPNSYSGSIAEYTVATNTLVDKKFFDKFSTGIGAHGNLIKSSITSKYYGVTLYGGTGDNGVLFEFDNALDTIIKKRDLSPSINGKNPTNSLLHASNGKLYGVARSGGSGRGVVFEVDITTNTMVKKAEFDGANGAYPAGTLIEVNGKLYGTTYYGGNNDDGVLYEYDLSTTVITKLQDLDDFNISNSYSGLIEATNGKLYGTTYSGGSAGRGALFEYDIVLDTIIKKGDFGVYGKGSGSYSKLLQATNGKLYGTCYYAGKYNRGDVFEFDFVTDSIRSLMSFNDTNGSYPRGGLTQSSSGKLYGVTPNGFSAMGTNNGNGILYEFDIATEMITPKAYFDRYTTGYGGYGELLEASNGLIYGISRYASGTFRGGRVVEFNPANNNFLSKSMLSGQAEGGLIEVVSSSSSSITENESVQNILIYPNPTSSTITIDTEGVEIINIKIFSVTGQLVDSKLNSNNTIDVSNYKNGLYIIRVETENGIALSRFIKK